MISVVIPTVTGREDFFERCVYAYEHNTANPIELIIYKDLPTCGRGWIKGAEDATGDYVHFTADDLEPALGWDDNGRGMGWHFTYLGGKEAIQRKIGAAAHHELNQPHYTDPEWLDHCLTTGADIFRRPEAQSRSVPADQWPSYVRDNAERFAHLIGPEI